ncbi:MAG TPA: DMT family transporter [Nocardioidaceae bacterium]|nr:DMT family transporter [Nocardioidaceae bacterium]
MQAYLLCVLVVVFYAGNLLTGKALNGLPPVTIAFTRLVIAFLILLPIGWRSAWLGRRSFVEHGRPLLIMTATGVAFFTTLIYAALQSTSATNVSVLEAAIPAVTVVLSVFAFRERLRPLQWMGVAVSLFGAVSVVMDGNILALGSVDWNQGDGIMVAAVLCWAVYSVTVRRHMRHFPEFGALLVMTGLALLALCPLVVAEWVVIGEFPLEAGPHWWGLLYLGVFPSVVALAFYNRAVATLGASQASAFLNFLPVATMLGAYLILDEQISAAQISGAALVMAGVFLTLRAPPRSR